MDSALRLQTIGVLLVVLGGNASLGQTTRLMPFELPGVEGQLGSLGVTDFRLQPPMVGPTSVVASYLHAIAQGAVEFEEFSGQFATSDLSDGGSALNGGPVIFRSLPHRLPIASGLGTGASQFISVAKAFVTVPETGTYTINVHSDDGFAIELPGHAFQHVIGSGRLADQNAVMYFENATTDSDTQGIINLPAGTHELRFFAWNADGGAYWEITTARGDVRHELIRYQLIGETMSLPEVPIAGPYVKLVGTAEVVQVLPEAGGDTGNLADAHRVVMAAAAAGTGVRRNDVSTVVLTDHDKVCCQRPGGLLESIGESFRWPANEVDLGGTTDDLDHFSSGLFGKLTVDDGDAIPNEVLPLTFGLFSSDGAALRVKGASFRDASENAVLELDADGDVTLAFPEQTGNSNVFGLISLQEGVVYDFEGTHFEHRGDSGFEIWTALGDFTEIGFTRADFFPLSSSLSQLVYPATQGWGLAERPIKYCDFDGDGVLTVRDVNQLLRAVESSQHEANFDVNRDGSVDRDDIVEMITGADKLNTYVGDVDLDGEFNSSDFVVVFLAGQYEDSKPRNSTWETGDWDGDLEFSSADLIAAFLDGGYERGPRLSANAVPEPSSWILVLPGVVMALLRCVRRV